jgi:hypothetical protein
MFDRRWSDDPRDRDAEHWRHGDRERDRDDVRVLTWGVDRAQIRTKQKPTHGLGARSAGQSAIAICEPRIPAMSSCAILICRADASGSSPTILANVPTRSAGPKPARWRRLGRFGWSRRGTCATTMVAHPPAALY